MIGRRVPPAYAPIAPLSWAARGGGARARLRERLLDRFAAEDARLTASGTEALRLAVRAALRLAAARRGDPGAGHAGARPRAGAPRGALVGVPAFTCYDVGAAVLAETGRLACFDIEPTTLAPEPESVARVLQAGAAALVVSPLFGVPVPWETLERAADDAGAVLVEDAAQGHGAALDGRPLGTLGGLSVLSFARGKGWTGGAGGAVLARGEAAGALAASAELPRPGRGREARLALAATAQWALGRPAFYGIPAALPWLRLGETVYREAPDPGAMPEVAARIALASEAAADAEAAIRRRRASWLRSRLPARLLVRWPRGASPGWLRLPVLLPADEERAEGRAPGPGWRRLPASASRLGISPAYPARLPDLSPVAAALADVGGPWPGAARLARDLVTLPTHSLLHRNDAERMLRVLHTLDGPGWPESAP